MKYRCSHCGAGYEKWAGRCVKCSCWNVLTLALQSSYERHTVFPSRDGGNMVQDVIPITEAKDQEYVRLASNLPGFDLVLGGGAVEGGAYFIAGEPGAGKSTILAQWCDYRANQGDRILYASGEQREGEVAANAKRVGAATSSNFLLTTERNVAGIESLVAELSPRIVVVDSVITTIDEGSAGNDRIKRVCARLTGMAKSSGALVLFLIGHVNKRGGISGPKFAEHIVDCTLMFTVRKDGKRVLRADKNRFGNTMVSGIFEMTESGLKSV